MERKVEIQIALDDFFTSGTKSGQSFANWIQQLNGPLVVICGGNDGNNDR